MESLPSTVVTASRPRLDVDEVTPHQEVTPLDPLAARGTPSSTPSMVLAEESSQPMGLADSIFKFGWCKEKKERK